MRLSRRDFWWLSHVQCHQVTTTIHWSIELAIHAPCKGPSLDDALRPTHTVGLGTGFIEDCLGFWLKVQTALNLQIFFLNLQIEQ